MGNIEKSLRIIGKDENLRNKFIEFIKNVETNIAYEGNIREEVTKHLVDGLFEENDFVIKSVSNGLKYKFYTGIGSKIAREFLMSAPTIPEFAWEPQTTKLLIYLSKNAKNIIVGGAYFGDQVIPIANSIKHTDGKVHAFDLNNKQIEILNENAALNNLNNINSVKKGLWNDSKTFLNLSDSDDLAFATPAVDITHSNTITIDEYLSANTIENVDLIMLDVEGAEYNILLGAQQQLKKDNNYPNIVFEIHSLYVDWSNGLDNTPIVKLLKDTGYTVFSIRDFQGNYDMKNTPIELIPSSETYIEGPKHGFNMLAIKNLSLIDNNLFKICTNVSPKYIVNKNPKLHHPIDGL